MSPFKTIRIENIDYYLVPVGFIESIISSREQVPEIIPQPEEKIVERSLVEDFVSDYADPIDSYEESLPEVGIAKGKPSLYRNRFLNKELTPREVVGENTANLSSLRARVSTKDSNGKESAFEEVTF